MNLLIEFQSEEIPARMQPLAERDLTRLFESFCIEQQLSHQNLKVHSTPRRLTLECTDLPTRQDDQVIERKGPKLDAPQAALDGFFNSCGCAPEECEKLETPKGTFWLAKTRITGKSLEDLVLEFIENTLKTFPWPKSMRWSDVPFKWVRPLHSILALVGDSALSGEILKIPLVATTMGHRFLGNKVSPELTSVTNYHKFLEDNAVVLDREARKQLILTQIQEIEKSSNTSWSTDIHLLDEVVGLVEYPRTLTGQIDADFMDLPKELIVSVMKTHQRYFSFKTADGKLAPIFGVSANNLALDSDPDTVIHGNEKVLRARLSDGKFYWEMDKRTSLDVFSDRLSNITFHQKLGTLKDKRDRVVLVARLLNQWFGLPQDLLKDATSYCKADLTSGVVGEFPELQGIMGGYYATLQGKPEISEAISDHYKPQGPNDSLPRDLLGIVVALADKLDTLVSFFGINEAPTGSKDPFALRRNALGILRLIFEAYHAHGKELNIPLETLIESILKEQQLTLGTKGDIAATRDAIVMFQVERLKVSLRDNGFSADLIDAVLSSGTEGSLIIVRKKVETLSTFLKMQISNDLLDGYNRLWKLFKSQKLHPDSLDIDPELLQEEAEQLLYKEWQSRSIETLVLNQKYEEALVSFTEMKPFIDKFFDKILVNVSDDNLRRNRLALIVAVLQSMKSFAAIEKIAQDKQK